MQKNSKLIFIFLFLTFYKIPKLESVPNLRKIELKGNLIASVGNEFNYVADTIIEIGLAKNIISFMKNNDAKYWIENLKKLENLKTLEIQGNNLEKDIPRIEVFTIFYL